VFTLDAPAGDRLPPGPPCQSPEGLVITGGLKLPIVKTVGWA